MDAKYLAEIKAREQAATPGPWECETHHTRWGDVHEVLVNKCNPSTVSDCYFIAHARTDISALVAEVERLQNENKRLKEELREWENMTPEEAGEMLAGM
ncbi:hypothetical protein [Faecalispora sporosphaeroides]|uniref:hypothetical protein n=1 Tax=Faecalispora sporosphaeroides TaxID=1549 RepID=UPI0003733C56|nr:hypothetical protein [Faecalispora sporosphaeroides]